MKKYRNYLLAFLFPFVICILFLGFKGVLNNIDSIYVSDLSGQHLPFLNYLKGVMLGRESLEYSFRAGIGSPMLSTMIYYCVSPFNILLILINDVQWAILFIAIIKVSLAGLTTYIFLKNKFNKDSFVAVVFATCYALSSFVINFWFCGFWFDSLYLAPLVMLGIENMYRCEKINYLYIFSLALAIICNIQMGFGLCIYSVIYFLYSFSIRYRLNNFKKFKKLFVIFLISSLCAGGISSGILLGFLSQYSNIVAARQSNESLGFFASNIIHIIKNLFNVGRAKKFSYNDYEPYIYCGLVITYFSIMYFLNTKISKRKKICSSIVIMVFIISFCISPLNVFWHISTPVLLNYRYSYCLSLFLVSISYECFMRRCRLNKSNIKTLLVFTVVASLILMIFEEEVYNLECVIFMALVLSFIILSRTKGKKYEKYLVIIIVAEVITNAYTSIHTAFDYDPTITPKITSYSGLKKLGSLNDFEDDYRVLNNYDYADHTNEGFLLNKNSDLRYFSSVINGNLVDFFSKNQSYVGWNNYRVSAYESPILLSLLGNRYFYLTEDFDNGLYKKISTYKIKSYDYKLGRVDEKKVYLYENPYALSVGYMINKDVKYKKGDSLIEYQNQIMESFSNNYKNVAERVDVNIELDAQECLEEVPGSCVIYHLSNSSDNSLVYFYRPKNSWYFSKDYKNYNDNVNISLISTDDKDIDIKVISKFDDYPPGFVVASTFNTSKLISNLNILRENMLYDVKMDKNVMRGKIDASKDGILFLSIPYDDKFKVYIDGKKSKYYSLLDDTFMGLDITKGKHKIVLKYSDSDSYKWYILSSSIFIVITFVVKYFINRLFDNS